MRTATDDAAAVAQGSRTAQGIGAGSMPALRANAPVRISCGAALLEGKCGVRGEAIPCGGSEGCAAAAAVQKQRLHGGAPAAVERLPSRTLAVIRRLTRGVLIRSRTLDTTGRLRAMTVDSRTAHYACCQDLTELIKSLQMSGGKAQGAKAMQVPALHTEQMGNF